MSVYIHAAKRVSQYVYMTQESLIIGLARLLWIIQTATSSPTLG